MHIHPLSSLPLPDIPQSAPTPGLLLSSVLSHCSGSLPSYPLCLRPLYNFFLLFLLLLPAYQWFSAVLPVLRPWFLTKTSFSPFSPWLCRNPSVMYLNRRLLSYRLCGHFPMLFLSLLPSFCGRLRFSVTLRAFSAVLLLYFPVL